MSTTNFKKNNISTTLKSLRTYKNVTISKLSESLQSKYNKIKNYEFDKKLPPNDMLIKLSSFFGVSIDFILLGNICNYIKNIKLIKKKKKIDKLNADQRYKVESTMDTFLKSNEKSFFDSILIDLEIDIHRNIKILRNNRNLSQKMLADELGLTSSAIGYYETNKNPVPNNLVKLSNYFSISIHALLTGKKLSFNFINKGFENTVLMADKQLELEEQKFLIKLMKNILGDEDDQ